MNEHSQASVLATSGKVARWSARILSAMILLFYGVFIVAEFFGDQGSPSRPLRISDYLILCAMATWLLGLAAAWKWELPGALIALAAALFSCALNWRMIIFPGSIIVLNALLFLWADLSRRLGRRYSLA